LKFSPMSVAAFPGLTDLLLHALLDVRAVRVCDKLFRPGRAAGGLRMNEGRLLLALVGHLLALPAPAAFALGLRHDSS